MPEKKRRRVVRKPMSSAEARREVPLMQIGDLHKEVDELKKLISHMRRSKGIDR